MRNSLSSPRQMADVMRRIFATLGLLYTSAEQESGCNLFANVFIVLQISNNGSYRVKNRLNKNVLMALLKEETMLEEIMLDDRLTMVVEISTMKINQLTEFGHVADDVRYTSTGP